MVVVGCKDSFFVGISGFNTCLKNIRSFDSLRLFVLLIRPFVFFYGGYSRTRELYVEYICLPLNSTG